MRKYLDYYVREYDTLRVTSRTASSRAALCPTSKTRTYPNTSHAMTRQCEQGVVFCSLTRHCTSQGAEQPKEGGVVSGPQHRHHHQLLLLLLHQLLLLLLWCCFDQRRQSTTFQHPALPLRRQLQQWPPPPRTQPVMMMTIAPAAAALPLSSLVLPGTAVDGHGNRLCAMVVIACFEPRNRSRRVLHVCVYCRSCMYCYVIYEYWCCCVYSYCMILLLHNKLLYPVYSSRPVHSAYHYVRKCT